MTAKFGISCTQGEAKTSGVFIAVCKSEAQAQEENISYEKAASYGGLQGTVRHFYEPNRGYYFYWFPEPVIQEESA